MSEIPMSRLWPTTTSDPGATEEIQSARATKRSYRGTAITVNTLTLSMRKPYSRRWNASAMPDPIWLKSLIHRLGRDSCGGS